MQSHIRRLATVRVRVYTQPYRPSNGTSSARRIGRNSKPTTSRALASVPMASTSALPTHVGKQAVSGGIITDRYELEVPLNYDDVDARKITVSYRVVRGESSLADKYLVYLQGGPGYQSPSPSSASSGWIKAALDEKYSVVLLDQRGTGFSSAVSCRSLESVGSPAEQAAYLKHFRADSIVRDLEAVRQALDVDKWTTLGQSYGGFLTFTYLCTAPESLKACMTTGGIPPCIDVPMSADIVYEHTIKRVITQNAKFYTRYPEAKEKAIAIVNYLAATEDGHVVTPNGNHLTPSSFQLLGLGCLGFSGGFEKLYGMIESAFEQDGALAFSFLKEFDASIGFDANPIYAILHESIYCSGGGCSNWAAARVRSRPEYCDLFDAAARAAAGKPVYFTGEMVFPFVFEDIAELRRIRDAAELIANDTEWTELYPSWEELIHNTVPIAAACYFEDMFVDFKLAEQTIEKVCGVRQFVSNEYLHCGLRENGARIFGKLHGLIDGKELLR